MYKRIVLFFMFLGFAFGAFAWVSLAVRLPKK